MLRSIYTKYVESFINSLCDFDSHPLIWADNEVKREVGERMIGLGTMLVLRLSVIGKLNNRS